ncbi:hypothetical protein [Novipirellula artificiosorum]|uniref:hypothetical protein n=1 Tax=Novipirellula artificiosorum TaxID=2528016 RepID=UPI0011B6C494|nr:hypothetical protein [Novipirellula artificiosorum]
MKTNPSICLALMVTLTFPIGAQAQQDDPHIGYVYPAGGRLGTTFQVLLGGQHLDGATAVHISGDGIEAEVIEHIRPLNQGQFKEIQNRMGELRKNIKTAEDEAALTELRQRLATFSIRRSSASALVETVTLQVTISSGADIGNREMRLLTEQGLTNPMVFCIDQLAETTELSGRNLAVTASESRGGRGRKKQQNTRPDPGTSPVEIEAELPTDITLPTIVNGQILPGDADRYRFHARQGEQLVVNVSARRLIPYLSDAVPGWFQAVVAIYDADGRRIAFQDDFHLHPDPVLYCEIPKDGQYIVEIRDALYRGREDFVYRFDIGELPFFTSIFPLGGQAEVATRVEFSGWNLPMRTEFKTFKASGIHSISVRDGKRLSNRLPFAVDTLPECSETEPNNELGHAEPVTMPVIVNGRIASPGDVDMFCFEGRAGDNIVAEVKARRLGSPLDSALKLTSASGDQLAFNDDYEDRAAGLVTHHADARVSFEIPADGLYYLSLGDLQQKGGPEYGYRLHINQQQPDFELRVVPSSINARAGSNVPITVYTVRRDGFADEILLTLVDPPPGYSLRGGRIPAGQDVIRLTLTGPEEYAGKPQSLVIEGRSIADGYELVRRAVPADDQMQAFANRHLVTAKELLVAVTGSSSLPLMNVLGDELVQIPDGGTVEVPISVPSRSAFGEIQLELSDPPEGISIQSTTLGYWRGNMILRSEQSAQSGLQGNLIVNVYAAKTSEDSGKGKEQRKNRRILLNTLPAIPFEIVAD